MYITPIESTPVSGLLPDKADRATGLFAWGRPQIRGRRRAFAVLEFSAVFLGLPALALAFPTALATPLVMAALVSAAILLLSLTKSFHWADLSPVDFWSEWRLLLGASAGFVLLAAAATAAFWPDRLLNPAPETVLMVAAFPVLTALPIELVYRALFYRRYGHLFHTERSAILVGGAASALAYLALSNSPGCAVFGLGVGLFLGWAYLRTGCFLLTVLLHSAAAAALFLVGPGAL